MRRKLLQEKLAYILKADGSGKLWQCKVIWGNKLGDMRVSEKFMFAHVFEDFSIRIGKVEKLLPKSRILGVDYVQKK